MLPLARWVSGCRYFAAGADFLTQDDLQTV